MIRWFYYINKSYFHNQCSQIDKTFLLIIIVLFSVVSSCDAGVVKGKFVSPKSSFKLTTGILEKLMRNNIFENV